MANIINVQNTHKGGLKHKRWIVLGLALMLIIGAGGYAVYRYYPLGNNIGVSSPTAQQERLAVLQKTYDASKQAAIADPQNASKQQAASDAKSALANEYLAKKDYAAAQATLDDGATSLQKMQTEAIVAEKKGDVQGAIDALRQQIAYFKALPATDYDYNYDISRAERKIAELQEGP